MKHILESVECFDLAQKETVNTEGTGLPICILYSIHKFISF